LDQLLDRDPVVATRPPRVGLLNGHDAMVGPSCSGVVTDPYTYEVTKWSMEHGGRRYRDGGCNPPRVPMRSPRVWSASDEGLLAVIGGRTAKEISDVEQIPLGTAKTRIRSAMQKLRADLTLEPES